MSDEDRAKYRLLINELADNSIGVYGTGGYKATDEEKHTLVYKAGFNDHRFQMLKKRIEVSDWLKTFTDEEKDIIFQLYDDGELFIHIDETITLNLYASDLFVWGCADSEEIKKEELPEVFAASKLPYGTDKWICKRRNEKPQMPIQENMKKAGAWDDEMEKLNDNYYWARLNEKKNSK